LFFTKPPVVHDRTVRGSDGQPLRHTEKYLKAKEEKERMKEERKRARKAEGKERMEVGKRVRV